MTLQEQILAILQTHSQGYPMFTIARILNISKDKVYSALSQLKEHNKCNIDNNYIWTIAHTQKPNQKEVTSIATSKKVLTKTEEKTNEEKKTTKLEVRSPQKSETSSYKTKLKAPCDVPFRPKSENAEDLFEYAVKHLADISQKDKRIFEPKMHNQWYNTCFGYPGLQSWQRQEYMSLIKSTYRPYFEGRVKYTFDLIKIECDFPQFFKGYQAEPIMTEIVKAVKSELEFAKNPKNKECYSVESIEKQPKTNNIYCITLNLKDDDEPHFYEGVKITLKVDYDYFNCEGLDYDIANGNIFVTCNKHINSTKNVHGYIYMDSSFILDAIYEHIINLSKSDFDSMPIKKFFDNRIGYIDKIKEAIVPLGFSKGLDASQKAAYIASLENDLTFIWGPPGTGKSYTLATIIRALYTLKESTIVCCISNVAVDQLLNKVVVSLENEIHQPVPGQIYRAGRSLNENIIKTDYLFPEDELTKKCRSRLGEISSYLQTLGSSHNSSSEELMLKQERLDLSEKLKNQTQYLISNSYIIFSTIANFILTPELFRRKFDNLIVDEASMLSIPYLMAIAQRVFKRIILVGDPQQLGPISITPNKWLRHDIFSHFGVIQDEPSTLRQLLVQRRSHPSIVNLINNVFYKGKLEAVQNEHPNWVKKAPYAGHVVQVVNHGIDNNEVKYIGNTRRNFGTQKKVMNILDEYHKNMDSSFSIGIITPYRGQVKLYIRAIKDQQNGDGFWESIKVGTIHTFQGSECDLIFVDLVEKAPTAVGKLFDNETGERLINVALSRAKHKLIVVGDTQRFCEGAGIANVSTKVSRVLSNLV